MFLRASQQTQLQINWADFLKLAPPPVTSQQGNNSSSDTDLASSDQTGPRPRPPVLKKTQMQACVTAPLLSPKQEPYLPCPALFVAGGVHIRSCEAPRQKTLFIN